MLKRRAPLIDADISIEVPPSQPLQAPGAGKIKSVYCKDFVTYEECSFHPTEYLNIIIGPNGTGKSTLVAAIVLGLGGEPKLLSRSSSISDYVKNGKTTAQIDVEIFANNDGKTVIFRRIFNEAGKSEYMVNEDKVSRANYLKAIAAYNIQIHNLCQFLPQDKVQDFAKMNPQEILNNTISSVCSQDVIDNFDKLKELRKNHVSGKKNLESDMQKLKESMLRKEELKQILERYNTRKEFLEKLNICNAKKLWLEADQIKVKTVEICNDLKDAKKSFEQRKKAHDNVMKEQDVIERKNKELSDETKKKEMDAKNANINKNIISEKIEHKMKEIRNAKTDFEKRKREVGERQSDLRNEAKMLEVIVEDLRNATVAMGPESERTSKVQELEEEMERYKTEIKRNIKQCSYINKKLDEEFSSEVQMLKNRIERSQNVATQKLQLLQSRFPDVHKALQWLEQNRDMFQGVIYKPVILELNVPDANNAQYFENTIPLRDLLSFVCEHKADVSTLSNELCIKQKLSINIAHSLPAEECLYRPQEPISHLQKYGFTGYLIDLIEGPPAILNYLCSLFKLHHIPIGTEQVNRHTDSIPTNIRQYFGGSQRFNVSISKYSKEPSLMQNHIQGKNLLLSCDMSEIQRLQQSLQKLLKKSDVLKNERTTIEATINELEFKRTEIMNQKRTIDGKLARFNQLKDQLKRQQNKISQLQTNLTNIADLERDFKYVAITVLRQILALQNEKLEMLKKYQKTIESKKTAATAVQIYKEQTQELTNAISEARENLTQAQKVVDTVTNALDVYKKKYKVKCVQAQNLTNERKPSDADFPYTSEFAELPEDLEQLKETINDFAARLDCMGDVDQAIVSEFERCCAVIEALEKQISDTLHGEQDITAEINAIFTDWFPQITRIVDTLNTHFGEFMESMSYVGEVLLARKEDFDFDSYGIQIMVQYRKNVPLQALDRHVQSGGERAVAIAVYTLSLQHITHVPFRCVDEINQGMDARNERKIFEMLVDETTQTGRSQYFFVTPKLLPNLKFNDRMTVHIVFNGKMVQSRNAFSFTL